MLKPGVAVDVRGASKSDIALIIDKCVARGATVKENCGDSFLKFTVNFDVYLSYTDSGMPLITVDQALGRNKDDAKTIADGASELKKVIAEWSNSDNSWQERGELPPVGADCEYYRGEHGDWKHCKIEFIGRRVVVMSGVGGSEFCRKIAKLKFRPLKTEREKFIELLRKEWESQNKSIADFFADQYDKGLRYIE